MHQIKLLASLAATSVFAAVVRAAEEPGHGDAHAGAAHAEPGVIPSWQQGLLPAIVTLVVFGIVFGVLYAKVWPVIVKGLDERSSKIESEIAAAEAARKQAKDALEEYERSLSQARAEAQKMLDDTRAQQGALAAELKAKADSELGQMRERAMKDIESAKRAALNEIYAETANLATHVAAKVLGREVSAADQSRLVDESLRELSSVRAN